MRVNSKNPNLLASKKGMQQRQGAAKMPKTSKPSSSSIRNALTATKPKRNKGKSVVDRLYPSKA